MVQVAGSGDLDPFVAKFNLDTKPATDSFNVFPQCVDLGTVNVAVLDPGHPVLADVQPRSQLDLCQLGCLTELPKPVRPDLIEQELLVPGKHLRSPEVKPLARYARR